MDNYFASQIRPKNFYGPRSEELKYDKSFEKNCIILAQYANKPVKNSTTKEYFALLDFHNKKIMEQSRGKIKGKR